MINPNDQIERWTNVERVLYAMPEHERQFHWNMATWGQETDCGTVACAAGTCGLDPWFRERDFKLDFVDGEAQISSVENFFGVEGTQRIFLNTTPRPVETVLDEVRVYLADLRRMDRLNSTAPCKVGEEWAEQGGIFAGACAGRGSRDYFLILGPEYGSDVNWYGATDWAAALDIAGHRDFALPLRVEQAVLFDRLSSLFQRNWYWSCEQHESYSSHAYNQAFYYGLQGTWYKGTELLARAVRRLIIQ